MPLDNRRARQTMLSGSAVTFLRENARWLAAGFLLAFGSSFGQTYFIAIFAEPIRAEFGLSHGEWGAIYMIGTLASAAMLIQLGKRADTAAPRVLALTIILAFAAVCIGMASIWTVWALPFLVFGLRLCGQGLLSHLSSTLTARWFVATRGKALAIASFGYPLGEAVTPIAAVGLFALVGWRGTWLVAAAVLALVLLPILWMLLARERQPRNPSGAVEISETLGLGGKHWTRGEAVRSFVFWLVAIGMITPSFIVTVVFFLPAHIAASKGWALEAWAASYSLYAATAVASSFATGWAIDRFNARSLLPVYQAPLAIGLVMLSFGTSETAMAATMITLGVASGTVQTVHSALLAELFGTRHLGAVKALGHAVMVLGSAIGPGIVGVLLDSEIDFDTQCLWMAAHVALLCVLYAVTQPILQARR